MDGGSDAAAVAQFRRRGSGSEPYRGRLGTVGGRLHRTADRDALRNLDFDVLLGHGAGSP